MVGSNVESGGRLQEAPFLKSSNPGQGFCISLQLGLASSQQGPEISVSARARILELGGEDPQRACFSSSFHKAHRAAPLGAPRLCGGTRGRVVGYASLKPLQQGPGGALTQHRPPNEALAPCKGEGSWLSLSRPYSPIPGGGRGPWPGQVARTHCFPTHLPIPRLSCYWNESWEVVGPGVWWPGLQGLHWQERRSQAPGDRTEWVA